MHNFAETILSAMKIELKNIHHSEQLSEETNAFSATLYKLKEENAEIPLKRFVYCDECEKLMRGYIVKGKNIHYYKCNTKGCGNHKSATALNQQFVQILSYFRLDAAAGLKRIIKDQAIASFNQLTKDNQDEHLVLKQQHEDLVRKMARLEERYIEEEINGELYTRYMSKFKLEKKELEENLLKAPARVSDLQECIDLVVKFTEKLPLKWRKADYYTKQKIQFLIFPEGIGYNKKNDGCRTRRINSVFLYIAYFQQVIAKKERGIPELSLDFASFADCVAGSRIELPTLGL